MRLSTWARRSCSQSSETGKIEIVKKVIYVRGLKSVASKLKFNQKKIQNVGSEPMFSVQSWMFETETKGVISNGFYWNLCNNLIML